MSTNQFFCRVILALLGSALLGDIAVSQDLRYYPERGQAAIHQRALELGSGGVLLLVALQPGYEDLPLLAHLRMGIGARAVVAYVTNGDATPADNGFTAPVFAAAERKEEAFAATRMLGVTAHFLNLPDPGVVRSREALLQIWNADTARGRLEKTLRQYRPDVVVVGGDFRGDTIQSVRQQLIRDLILDAVQTASRDTVRSDTVKAAGWSVPRVYLESARDGQNRAYDERHIFWKKSYRSIAAEAAQEYRSLWMQMGSWMRQGDRRYALIHHRGRSNPRSMLDGLPEIGARLKSLESRVRKAAARQPGGKSTPLLSEISVAIDSLDLILGRERRLIPSADLRLLAAWKNGLEELRCSLLDVRIDFTASESLVAPDQVFFLSLKGIASRGSGKRNWILFPGAIDHTWGINASKESQFSLNLPQEFQVLTPHQMELTVPVAQFGMIQSSMRTRFSFIVMHQDSLRARNFFYRGEVLLRVGPRRTYEVLTPVVRAIEGEGVSYRLLNISRDAYEGRITIVDTLANRVSKKVALPRKDFALIDTLLLSLRDSLPPGDYPMKLDLSGGTAEQFVARSFETRVDSQARIGLLTCIEEGPVAQALNRLRLPWRNVDTSFAPGSGLSAFNVIVVDRDATEGIRGIRSHAGAIREWVRAGGRLLVLPQSAAAAGGSPVFPGVTFGTSGQLSPWTPVQADSTRPLVRTPNRLTEADWEGWVVSRSLSSVNVAPDRGGEVVVRSRDENLPLVVELREGKGRITLVALDIISQLLNVHPGAHRILANMLTAQ